MDREKKRVKMERGREREGREDFFITIYERVTMNEEGTELVYI